MTLMIFQEGAYDDQTINFYEVTGQDVDTFVSLSERFEDVYLVAVFPNWEGAWTTSYEGPDGYLGPDLHRHPLKVSPGWHLLANQTYAIVVSARTKPLTEAEYDLALAAYTEGEQADMNSFLPQDAKVINAFFKLDETKPSV